MINLVRDDERNINWKNYTHVPTSDDLRKSRNVRDVGQDFNVDNITYDEWRLPNSDEHDTIDYLDFTYFE